MMRTKDTAYCRKRIHRVLFNNASRSFIVDVELFHFFLTSIKWISQILQMKELQVNYKIYKCI